MARHHPLPRSNAASDTGEVGVDAPELALYRSLYNVTLDGDLLRLPEGVTLVNSDVTDANNAIFVRPCYPQLYDILVTRRNAVLLGTPGIGKSTAVLYFIWRLLRETSPSLQFKYIVFRPQQKADMFLVFDAGTVVVVDGSALLKLSVPNALVIYDGCTPDFTITRCHTWLVSSPRKDVWGDWRKQTSAYMCYMPVFSLEELQRCREIAFPHLLPAQLDELYELWGGTARYTLSWSESTWQVQLISEASAAGHHDLVTVVAALATGGGEEYSASSHLLFHLAVDKSYAACKPIFASDFARDLVLSALACRGRSAIVSFLEAFEREDAFSSVCGQLFERLALSTLFSGSERDWQLVALDGNRTPSPLRLGSRPVAAFSEVEELLARWEEEPLAVGRPRHSHWPTWDAVSRDADSRTVTLWQMTVSRPEKRGITVEGLRSAESLVPPGYQVRFVFIVLPRGNTSAAFKAAPRSEMAHLPGWAGGMQQFVLPLEVDDLIVTRVHHELASLVDDAWMAVSEPVMPVI